MERIITIFGSAVPSAKDEQFEFAYKLGQKLAENGYAVCTGGYAGIMEAVSKGAYDKGGNIYGVTIENWKSSPNKFITIEIRTNNLFERISKLIELGDAFIILQGGTGTLLELATVWELMNKNLIESKPVVCHSNLWKQIVTLMNEQLAIEGKRNDIVKFANSIEEILSILKGNLIY
jgi:uncharacterized protein (TIGR00725 family)